MGSEQFKSIVYLFYGLAFFSMGVAITSKDIGASALKVGKIFWFFALFAYAHALHEWLELYLILFGTQLSPAMFPVMDVARLSLNFVSFVCLLLFGVTLLRQAPFWKSVRPGVLLFLCVVVWAGSCLLHGVSLRPSFFQFADFRLRNFIGFPAALFAGLGFIVFSSSTRIISEKGARNLVLAGSFLILYGILAGLIPSGTTLPLARAQVELLRGITAFLILHFIMNGLHIFDIKHGEVIEDRLNRFAQSEKLTAIGKLAAGIVHEVNTPLTNISLNVEMLKRDLSVLGEDQPGLQRRFMALERNIDRASRIAQELLYFSQEKESEFVSTDLNEVIRSTLTLLGPRKKDYRIDFELGEISPIRAVPWKLEEVFLNLLINAMDASEKGARIVLSTTRMEKEVTAKIVDTGVGIPQENLGSIFDPFFTTKEVGKGTGLGLAICYGIVQMHRGRMEVNSQPGRGTVVVLYFPIGGDDGV